MTPVVWHDANKLAQSAILSAKMFDFDSVIVPYDMCCESEAIGNTISLYEDSTDILYPTIPEKMWKNLEDLDIPSLNRPSKALKPILMAV